MVGPEVIFSDHCGLFIPEDEALLALAVCILEEGHCTLSVCIVRFQFVFCPLRLAKAIIILNISVGDVASSADCQPVRFGNIHDHRELDVLTAEHRIEATIDLVVYRGNLLVVAIVALSCFSRTTTITSEPCLIIKRAAIVAGIVDSICGAHQAGSCESFDRVVHVHF